MRETRITLSHEFLVTFVAEVMAIVNSRPLSAVSSDSESPKILSLNMILALKDSALFSHGDNNASQKQWRQGQSLADTFWYRFRTEYLSTINERRKWDDVKRELKCGDFVLLKTESHRNDWPCAMIKEIIPSSDGPIRKAKIQIHDAKTKNKNCCVLVRN